MMCNEGGCMAKRHLPRVFLALLFIVGGAGFLLNFTPTSQYVAMGLTPWGMAGMATLATVVAIVLKLGGGLMLLVNKCTSTAAWMLIAFTVVATLMFHMGWSGEDGQMQMTQFLKNLAIIGGLMMFAHCPCAKCKESCKNGDSCCNRETTPVA